MKLKKKELIGIVVLTVLLIPLMSMNNSVANPIPGPVPEYPHTVEITSPYTGQGIPYTTTEITFSGISITEELDGNVEYYYTYAWYSIMGWYDNKSGNKYADSSGILTIVDMDFVFDEIDSDSYPVGTDQSLTLEVVIFEDSGFVWELSATQSTNIWFREAESTEESNLGFLWIFPTLLIMSFLVVRKKKNETEVKNQK